MDKVLVICLVSMALVASANAECSDCKEIEKSCPTPNCGPGSVFSKDGGGDCGCCPTCLKVLGEGETGCIPLLSGAVAGVCGEGLECAVGGDGDMAGACVAPATRK